MRVPRVLYNPEDPKAVAEHASRLQRVVDGQIEFGSPQDPNNPASTTLANGTVHNGILQNILGAWVQVDVVALDTAVLCTHNLGVPAQGGNQPNVRWLVFGYQHSGNAANAASTISCNYELGDTINENAIQLRFYAGGARVVGADPDDIRVTLFFVPAVR